MNASRSRYLLSNTLIFGISNFGTKLISFFLVPLYTYTLTVSDYGVADLITSITIVLAPLLTLGLSDAVMRFPLDEDSDHNKILAVGIVALIFACIFGLLFIPLASYFRDISNYSLYMYLYCIASASMSMFQAFLRGTEKLREFAFSNILCTFLTASLNIFFLVYCHWGVAGYLLAYTIAMFLTAIYSIIVGGVLNKLKYLSFDKHVFFQMAKYSIPLIPTVFMWWIISSFDRVVVAALLGTAANGLLAVAYKLPSIISVISNTFTQAWSYSAIREENSEDRDAYASYIFNRLVAASGLITVLLLAFIQPITKAYVASAFSSAWHYSTWLLVANYLMTIGNFLGAFYTAHKDGIGFLISGIIGAFLNAIVLFALIPAIGLYGSAIANFICYAGVFIYRFIDTRKYAKISIDKRLFNSMLVVFGLLLTAPNFFGNWYLLPSIALILLLSFINKEYLGELKILLVKCGRRLVNRA